MENKLKTNSLHILKLNEETYVPFQPHNLPKYFNDIPLSSIVKFKSYIYINIDSLKKSLNYYKNNITFNKNLNSSLLHQK